RSSVESRLSDALARARLRAVRGESARRQGVERADIVRLHAAGGSIGDVPLPRARAQRRAVARADRARIQRVRTDDAPALMTATTAEQTAEHDEKLQRLARLAQNAGVGAILLAAHHNIAWLTSGRHNRVDN